jgi:Trp operon repressor
VGDVCREDIHYTEGTLYKVYEALRRSDATEEQAQRAINEMQNAGILFRERGANPYEAKKPHFREFSERTALPRDGQAGD